MAHLGTATTTKTVLHFGLAKTASSYLQRWVFPYSKGVNFLGKPFDMKQAWIERWAERYLGYRVQKIHRFDLFFEFEDMMRCQPYDHMDFSHYEAHLRKNLSNRDLNIWSHEGYLRPGRKSSPFLRKTAIGTIRRVFEAAGCEEVHALIVLRDTRDVLQSYAVQFHRDFNYLRIGDMPLAEVLAYRTGDSKDRLAGLFWRVWYEYFDYAALLQDLTEGFGAEHVHVLCYEDLVKDWALLERILQIIHPDLRCYFPDRRENITELKPATRSAAIQSYLNDLADFDIRQLYPENERVVQQYRHQQ
jgi:hypothetical protein